MSKKYILTPEEIDFIVETDDEEFLFSHYSGILWGDLCKQEREALQELAPSVAYELMGRGRIEVYRPDDPSIE